MKLAIIGTGAIAQRHFYNLQSIIPDSEIIILTRDENLSSKKKFFLGMKSFAFKIDDIVDFSPNAAFICSPSSLHIKQALKLVKKGIHTFIEKPLSSNLEGVNDLIIESEKKRVEIMIGYPLRFNPALKFFKDCLQSKPVGNIESIISECLSYLPNWRPNLDYRKSVSARKSLGGGVLLELSHEIDYLRWIFGNLTLVKSKVERKSDLEIDVEDTAFLALESDSGFSKKIRIELFLDFCSPETKRECKVTGDKGALKWNGISNKVLIKELGHSQWETLYNGNNNDNDLMYKEELSYFLDCITSNKKPYPSVLDANETLKIVLSAKKQGIKIF